MSRLTTRFTLLGLVGLLVAMLGALSGTGLGIVALGYFVMVMGFVGAVIGVASALGSALGTIR